MADYEAATSRIRLYDPKVCRIYLKNKTWYKIKQNKNNRDWPEAVYRSDFVSLFNVSKPRSLNQAHIVDNPAELY